MTRVVYNDCHGGFGLSDAAVAWLRERGLETDQWCVGVDRHHPLLVECVEALEDKADGPWASLDIATVGPTYRIHEYDGLETVQEPNDIEWVTP